VILLLSMAHAQSPAPAQHATVNSYTPFRDLPNGKVVDAEQIESPPTNAAFSGSGLDEDPPELPGD